MIDAIEIEGSISIVAYLCCHVVRMIVTGFIEQRGCNVADRLAFKFELIDREISGNRSDTVLSPRTG